jgi:SPP1 family predicted phage head-tail adaptor
MPKKSSNAALVRDKWLGINPSQLRHQVQIQSQQTTVGATGGQTSAGWSTIRTPFAGIESAGEKEDYQAGEFSSQVTDIITIRYAATPAITGGMRVLFNESNGTQHAYLIQAVDNVKKRNILLKLMCLEIDGGQ